MGVESRPPRKFGPIEGLESNTLFAREEVASTVGSLRAFFRILPFQAGNDNMEDQAWLTNAGKLFCFWLKTC